ncbi:MAG: tetratricopeptide repeat protein [Clostridiales bacterium]|nr:tetratricopeptide repeat protein [Clostridiales bacterium]
MRMFDNVRWLDVGIKGAAVLVVVAVGYLAYSVVITQSAERRGAPASRAVDNLIAAIEESPDDAGLRIALAEAYAAAGQPREAIDQFNAALELEANHPDALTGLGLIAMFQGEWETAEGYWRTLVDELEGGQFSRLDQRLGTGYHQLGMTLLEQKRYEEAAQSLHEALRINRSAADTHYALSVAYREIGSERNQRTYLESALMFDPVMPEANYDYGLLLLAEGYVAAAAERFRTSADGAPPGVREPFQELEKLGQHADRLEAARALVSSDPVAALTEARIARALEPTDLESARLVATLYESTGDLDAAMDAWQRVLDLAPDDAEAASAVERLSDTK